MYTYSVEAAMRNIDCLEVGKVPLIWVHHYRVMRRNMRGDIFILFVGSV